MGSRHAQGGLMHLTSSPIDWYAARAGGIAAYVLLTLNVSIGLLMTGKKRMKHWPRFALEDVHRFTGILTGTFVVLHIATVAIDSYLPFSVVSLAVPFISSYRPIWIGLGIVAAEMLLALAITNHYRNTTLSYRTWRRWHYVNFAVWTTATFHSIGSGTDRSTTWLLAIDAVAVGTVCGLTTWRILRRSDLRVTVLRGVAPVLAGVAGVVMVTALALGPLRFQPKPWNPAEFQDSLSGKILSNMGVTRGIVSMAGAGGGAQPVLVRADLLVTPSTLASTSFQMEYLPSGAMCTGTVTTVHATSFEANCTMPDRTKRFVSASWTAPDAQGSITNGTITSHA
jgi:sulfoxide reductase heme-binding subunit YedZ